MDGNVFSVAGIDVEYTVLKCGLYSVQNVTGKIVFTLSKRGRVMSMGGVSPWGNDAYAEDAYCINDLLRVIRYEEHDNDDFIIGEDELDFIEENEQDAI